MKRNKKILVIGSGFAGIACCLNLIENKYTPTLVDTGKSFKKDTTLNDLLSQKILFGIGASLASFLFFYFIGYLGYFLRSYFLNKKIWNILNIIIISYLIGLVCFLIFYELF